MGNTFTMVAQEDFCYIEEDSNQNSNENFIFSNSIDPAYLATLPPQYFNIKFWGVNRPNGSSPDPLTEQQALAAVAYLNSEFSKAGIYFKYRGFENFNSPGNIIERLYNPVTRTCFDTPNILPDGYANLYRCHIDDLYYYAEDNGYFDENAFNVYVPFLTSDGFGGANFPAYESTTLIRTSYLTDVRFLHEMGHSLGLRHTFYRFNEIDCERVTRDTNNTLFNAIDYGDRIIDTAAQDAMWGDIDGDCNYIGNGKDCGNIDPYEIFPNDTHNFMGYGGLIACGDRFTTGQKIRMHEHVNQSTHYDTRRTTIEAFYEPYKGEYYVSGPLDTGPSSTQYLPLFQPGFDYQFVECDCNQQEDCSEPLPYPNTNFTHTTNVVLGIDKDETNFNTITHPNHTAIKIDFNNPWVNAQVNVPRRCYDNWNRKPSAGIVTKFNDGVLNSNVTITPQDSTAINNPNLINNLQPGLYNIQKQYNDGSQQENVIVKENQE